MYLRKCTLIKYFIAVFVGFFLWGEWFVYIMQPVFWPELKCNDEETCTKILFIADPQIQGDLAVPFPLNSIFNWDSDRYLQQTFSIVIKYFKPDVLVYLGDLMDEGSIATMKQFHHYVARLMTIFNLNYSVVSVYIPGDNDIGGENEPIKKDKLDEFQTIFMQPNIVRFRNISFYKVNAITNTFPKPENDITDNSYKIIVSHYPVTNRHFIAHQVNNEIHPNIYFCAHTHESKYLKQKKDLTEKKTTSMKNGNEILNVMANDESLYEIYVPTCSYRMGTNKIGFGAAILENNDMKYTVFWSPQRFIYLFIYLIFLFVWFWLTLFRTRLFRNSSCWATSPKITKDTVPLLSRV